MDSISNTVENSNNSVFNEYTFQQLGNGAKGHRNSVNGEYTGYTYFVEGGYLFVGIDGSVEYTPEEAIGESNNGPWTPWEGPSTTTPWEGPSANPNETISNNNGSETNDTGNSGSGGGSASGGKIICVELYRQGLLSADIFEADEAFGRMLHEKYPLVLKGYQFWARPIVKQMRRSQLFTKMVYAIAKPWTIEMAHIMGKHDTGSIVGKILMLVGCFACWLIGFAISNKLFVTILLLIFAILLLLREYMISREKVLVSYKNLRRCGLNVDRK